jgi:hypothetical protein
MAHFRCLIRGEGFLGILEARDGPIGFYVNRPVEADDAEQARRAVLDAFHAELAERGWADKGGRVVVDEIDEIDASELSSIGQGFIIFPDEEAGAEQGAADMQTPFLLIAASGFSVYSDALPEPWLLTRRAMNSFRNAICYDASGTAHTITDVVPLRQMTLYDRMLPWRQIPVRLVLQPGPVLSLADIRARIVSALKGDNEIADFLKTPVNEASARLKKAGSALELIETANAIV